MLDQPVLPHGCLQVLLHALQHFCFAMLLLSCFQAALCSRCSQSHMCFFTPSNDTFPMKTVASTAFAVFVKNTNPTLWFSFQPSQNSGGGVFLSSSSTYMGTKGRRSLPSDTSSGLPACAPQLPLSFGKSAFESNPHPSCSDE